MRFTALDSITANPEYRAEKVLAEKEENCQRLLTGALGFQTPRLVLVLAIAVQNKPWNAAGANRVKEKKNP